MPEISAPAEEDIFPPPPKKTKEVDIIDILTGKASSHGKGKHGVERVSSQIIDENALSDDLATNLFSVSVPVGDKARGQLFLERMRTLLQNEPGSLIF